MAKNKVTIGQLWSTAWGYYLDKNYRMSKEMALKFIKELDKKIQ